MKILLFFGGIDSLSDIFYLGFKSTGHDVSFVNYLTFLPEYRHRIDNYFTHLPYRYRAYFRNKYLTKIQERYIRHVKKEQPDLVLIYNDQMVTYETAKAIKKNGCKLAVYLADSPFYLINREHILKVLSEADHVFAPDTYWLKQLQLIGITRTSFLIPGFNKNKYYKKIPTAEEKGKYSSDIIYLGSTYKNIWGYKRALFLNKFSKMDLKIYGPSGWQRWFNEFPDLKQKFIKKKYWFNDEIVNTIFNCCKIYPVDANPGLIYGLHIRIFECISSGILPLVEYRKDIDMVFKDIEIPIIYDYDESARMADEYLSENTKRDSTVKRLQEHINANYRPDQAASMIINTLKI
jgi:spore maturation protein CgeB